MESVDAVFGFQQVAALPDREHSVFICKIGAVWLAGFIRPLVAGVDIQHQGARVLVQPGFPAGDPRRVNGPISIPSVGQSAQDGLSRQLVPRAFASGDHTSAYCCGRGTRRSQKCKYLHSTPGRQRQSLRRTACSRPVRQAHPRSHRWPFRASRVCAANAAGDLHKLDAEKFILSRFNAAFIGGIMAALPALESVHKFSP